LLVVEQSTAAIPGEPISGDSAGEAGAVTVAGIGVAAPAVDF
jgi:hypothetical protein